MGIYARARADLKKFVDANPDKFGGISALRANPSDSLNKITLRMVYTYAFNGEHRGKVGDARDAIAEFVLTWLAREGVTVSIPAVRGGQPGQQSGAGVVVPQSAVQL